MRRGETRVEALDRKRHRVEAFDCGNPSLDRWLHAYAGQAQRADVARTYVAINSERDVVGFYTLVAGQVEHAEATGAVRKAVSRHFPIPIGLIARLAVAMSDRGKGLGTDLTRDALRRIVAASEQIGMRAALVHAVDERAAVFYERLGFEPATTDGLTLMVPLAAVRSALSATDKRARACLASGPSSVPQVRSQQSPVGRAEAVRSRRDLVPERIRERRAADLLEPLEGVVVEL